MIEELKGRGSRRMLPAAVIVLGLMLASLHASTAAVQDPLYLEDFSQAAPQGFGDPQNSLARASQWWNGRLYVATARSFACVQQAILAQYLPGKVYPPPDPTLACTPNPHDLPLQAEIWRWTPDDGAGTWEMVYRSPNNVPIPGTSKFTAREIGLRDMAVFTEPTGVEALYVTGITARGYIPGLPPPTILRSTDGVTFAPIPQDPGTVLGDLTILEGINIAAFNKITAFNGRLYVVAGGDFGHGVIFESADPAAGNDAFSRLTPPGTTFTYMQPFNGALYVAQGAQPLTTNPPYRILKIDTSTSPPTITTVVDGARLPAWHAASAPRSVATMHTAGGVLWVGTNQPVELVRINPNDTWDLFMGQPRQTVAGTWKSPLTGIGDSFDWYFNIHIHRMEDHGGYLYLASNDLSNSFPQSQLASYEQLFGERYGMDLHRTKNAWHLYPVTFGGFEELEPGGRNNWFNYTGRVATSTPYGLFLGTGNNQFGAQIWRATAGAASHVAPPERLEVERTASGVVLSWDPSPTAAVYRIFKADYAYGWQLGVPFYVGGTTYPRAFRELGTVTGTNYTDTTSLGLWSHYYVVAETAGAARSNPSNIARAPSLIGPTNFMFVQNAVNEWHANGEVLAQVQSEITSALTLAKFQVILGNYTAALGTLGALRTKTGTLGPPLLAGWRAEDLQVMLAKLMRRVDLARQGRIPALNVWF